MPLLVFCCNGRKPVFHKTRLALCANRCDALTTEVRQHLRKKRQVIMKYLFVEVLNGYRLIMNRRHNPLCRIPDTHTRHIVIQILACVWCLLVSLCVGSIVILSVSMFVHCFPIAGIFITLAVFDTAQTKPHYFRRRPRPYFSGLGRGSGGEHN